MVTLFLLLGCPGAAGDASPKDHDSVAVVDTGDTATDTGDSGDDSADSGLDTADPCDADADGALAGACGGDDCHDGDESIHPGAPELCDPVDHDCDGETLAGGVCAGPQDGNAAMSVVVWMCPEGDTSSCSNWGRLTPDVTGDGSSDVLVGCRGGCEGGGLGYGVLDVPTLDRRQTDEGRWFHRWFDGYGDSFAGNLPFEGGDFDGDGVNDLGFASSAWMFPVVGPFEASPDADGYHVGGDDYVFTGWTDGFGIGVPSATGDLDGDGDVEFAWAVAGTGSYPENQFGAGVYIVGMGGREVLDDAWPKIQIRPSEETDGLGGGALASPGDLDGDGIDELLMTYGGGTVLPGDSLAGADGAHYDDLATELWWNWGGQQVRHYQASPTRPGDVDGDGLDDWLLFASESTRYGDAVGELFFVAGGQRPPGEYLPDDANGSYVIPGEEYLSFVQAADLDGDGNREIAFQAHDTLWILRGVAGFPAFAEDPAERLAITNANDDNAGAAWYAVDGGHDVDGDGTEDLLFHSSGWKMRSGPAILLGWQIPWDEPQYW